MVSINDYKLERIIGKGSYGVIYSAKKLNNNKIYAIKKIKFSNIPHYETRNIINEIKILASHNCPYIIQYISVFIHINDICIVTEYAQKGDLLQLIKKHKNNRTKFTENEIWNYFLQICISLQYLHKNSIIHRDIKTANIFIDENNNIKLGDFGIIKILQPYMMFTQTRIGTPLYMGPEIYKHLRYNTKVDIWSLGCVLYEMITLKPAFMANNMSALQNKIIYGKFDIITDNYSIELKNLLNVLITVNPYRRYSIDNIFNMPIIKKKLESINIILPENYVMKPLFNEYCIIPKRSSDWNIIINKYNKYNNPLICNVEHNNNILEQKKLLNEKKLSTNKLVSDIDKDIYTLETEITAAKKLLDIKISQLEYLKKKRENINKPPILPNISHPSTSISKNPVLKQKASKLPSIYKYPNPVEKLPHLPPKNTRPEFISPKNKLIIKIGSKHENRYRN